MQNEKEIVEEPTESTPQEDMEAINHLAGDQVWLYVLTRSVPAGNRILPTEMILQRIEIAAETAGSLDRVFGYAARQIALFQKSQASTLAWLVDNGLRIDYGNLIVDVAASHARTIQEAMATDLTDTHRLELIENRLGRIEDVLTSRGKTKG